MFNIESQEERLLVEMSTTAGSSKAKPGLLDALLHLGKKSARVFYNIEKEVQEQIFN